MYFIWLLLAWILKKLSAHWILGNVVFMTFVRVLVIVTLAMQKTTVPYTNIRARVPFVFSLVRTRVDVRKYSKFWMLFLQISSVWVILQTFGSKRACELLLLLKILVKIISTNLSHIIWWQTTLFANMLLCYCDNLCCLMFLNVLIITTTAKWLTFEHKAAKMKIYNQK